MHLSKMRGTRLAMTGLLLAVLAGGLVISVSGATDSAPTAGVALADTTVPVPLTTTGTSSVTTTATSTPATTAAATKTTTATTRATTAPTTRPTTAKTSTPATTAPRTSVPTSAPTTTAPTYQAPATASLPPAVTVVSAPRIVAGAYTVPAGTGIFSVTSVGNVPVGGDGVVQLIVDNGWQPLFGDTYVDVSWDPSMVTYESAVIMSIPNTTATVSSDHSVRVMLGDFRRGYPQGRYPLALITLRAIREGTSTLTVSVDHVRYWSNDFTEFTDITATASGQSGIFSTGPLPSETVPLVTFTQNTLAPVTNPTSDVADLDTGFTTAPTTARTTEPTTIATVSTPPAVTTDLPPPATTQTPYAYGSYAPVSTRVQTSGLPPATAVAVSLAAIGGVALLLRRRE